MNLYISNAKNSRRLNKKHKDGLIYKVTKGIFVKKPKDIFTYIEVILEELNIVGTIFYKSALEYPKEISNKEIFILSDRTNKKIILGEHRDLVVIVLRITNDNLLKNFHLKQTNFPSINKPSFPYAILINFSRSSIFKKRSNKDLACELLIKNTLDCNKNINHIDMTLAFIYTFSSTEGMTEEYGLMKKYLKDYIQANYKDFDKKRITLLRSLKEQLLISSMPSYPRAHKNQLFYESYFSNYIEGIEFEVEEAERIIFHASHRYSRHDDGHDIICTYNIIKDLYETPLKYSTYSEFNNILKQTHLKLLNHRGNKILVGDFKKHANSSGSMRFVLPSLVNNTLKEGFDIFKELVDPLHKAIFIHLLIAEIHPFDDGNGRLSRIFMNNELSKAGLSHILIPTVFRDDYIRALKSFSHKSNPKPIISALIKAYAITNSIHWENGFVDINVFIRNKSGFEKDTNSMWGLVPSKTEIEEIYQL